MKKSFGVCIAILNMFVTIDSKTLSFSAALSAAAGEARTAEIVANQIRKQGYACDAPLSADRDKEHPNDRGGWILKCDGVTYHVHLVPNRAAKVQKVK